SPMARRWILLPDTGRHMALHLAAEALELRPWLDLCLDLGEGATSLAALPMLQTALTLAGTGTPVDPVPLNTRYDSSGNQVFVGVARPVEPAPSEPAAVAEAEPVAPGGPMKIPPPKTPTGGHPSVVAAGASIPAQPATTGAEAKAQADAGQAKVDRQAGPDAPAGSKAPAGGGAKADAATPADTAKADAAAKADATAKPDASAKPGAAAKPAATPTPAGTAPSADSPEPAESKPAESKPAELKPAQSKPGESKPAESPKPV